MEEIRKAENYQNPLLILWIGFLPGPRLGSTDKEQSSPSPTRTHTRNIPGLFLVLRCQLRRHSIQERANTLFFFYFLIQIPPPYILMASIPLNLCQDDGQWDYPFVSRTSPPLFPQRYVSCPEKTITEWSDISPFIWFLQSYPHAPY